MAAPQAVGEVYNIGSDVPVSMLELASRVSAEVDPDARRRVPIVPRRLFRAIFKMSAAGCPICRNSAARSTCRRNIDLDAIIRDVVAAAKAEGGIEKAEGGRGKAEGKTL